MMKMTRTRISASLLIAALLACLSVSLPPAARAQGGHDEVVLSFPSSLETAFTDQDELLLAYLQQLPVATRMAVQQVSAKRNGSRLEVTCRLPRGAGREHQPRLLATKLAGVAPRLVAPPPAEPPPAEPKAPDDLALPAWFSLYPAIGLGTAQLSVEGKAVNGLSLLGSGFASVGPVYGAMQFVNTHWGGEADRSDLKSSGVTNSYTAFDRTSRYGLRFWGWGGFYKSGSLNLRHREGYDWWADYTSDKAWDGSYADSGHSSGWGQSASFAGYGLEYFFNRIFSVGVGYYDTLDDIKTASPVYELFTDGVVRTSVMMQNGSIFGFSLGIMAGMPMGW